MTAAPRLVAGLEYWPLARLRPSPRNARLHSDEQLQQIAASIRAFGFNAPVLVAADGEVIAGHGRCDAARRLGLEAVPVVVLDHLSPQQRRAYLLADNQIALNATWDREALALELADLRAVGIEADLLGFGERELAKLLKSLAPVATQGPMEEDAGAPEPPAAPVTRLGDVWLLGPHRLVCGDSTDPAAATAAQRGMTPRLMVTDPPYGVEYDPEWRTAVQKAAGAKGGVRATGKVANDDRADWREAWALFPGDVAYVWHASRFAADVEASLLATGFVLHAQIIWAKQSLVLSRGHYHWQHEPAFYALRQGADPGWQGEGAESTLWEIANAGAFGGRDEDMRTGHGTQKPLECMARPMRLHTAPGEAVYEPFSGSGSTLIAAHKLGRRCAAVELSPAYVDAAVRRWMALTGDVARREADLAPFPAAA